MYYHVCEYELCTECGAMYCKYEMYIVGCDGDIYYCCPTCGIVLRTAYTTFDTCLI